MPICGSRDLWITSFTMVPFLIVSNRIFANNEQLLASRMATSAHLCYAMAELCPVQNCFWLEYIDGVSAQNITNGVTSRDH